MTKGKLDNGFEFEIDERNLDDMRFIEDLAAMDDNPLIMPRVFEKMLGKEQKEALYKHLEKDGRVSIADFSAAITEIFEKASTLKN
jgi:hypothetical protein